MACWMRWREIATATNAGAEGTTDIAQKTVEVKSEADT